MEFFLSSSDSDVPSKDVDDMALTCAMTTCAFRASSSSSFIRACLQAARFSASNARCSDGVRLRDSEGGFVGDEKMSDDGGDFFIEFSAGLTSAIGCRESS